ALPLVHCLRGDALGPELGARHVIGRVDEKEQREGQHVDADQHDEPIDQAADDVGAHAPPVAVRRSRRRIAATAGSTVSSSAAAISASGQTTGGFHSRRRSARSAGSSRWYLSPLLAIWLGLRL